MTNRFEIIDGKCVIPYGVSEILEDEFAGCEELKEIEIPDTVERIGGAFWGCSSLRSVRIPRGVKSLSGGTFFDCVSLEEVQLPDTLEEINKQAFERCLSLRSIYIPASVTSIDSSAFNHCPRLERIEVAPDNPAYRSECNTILTKDGKRLVLGCKTSVIPFGVSVISERAFLGCTRLKHIDIPQSVQEIEKLAFYGCTSLKRVLIPDSVKKLDALLFYECYHLKEIILRCPYNCYYDQVWDYTFGGIDNLRNLYLSHGPEESPGLAISLKNSRVPLRKITLHVPDGTEKAYKAHPYYKKFKYITTE